MHSILEQVQGLVPSIAQRADEVESQRRLPQDMLDSLIKAGCYRMFAPAQFGGASLELSAGLQVIEVLSGADASVGWTVGQAALSQIIFRHLPAPTVDEIFAHSPDVFGAGAFAAKGRSTRHGDRWRVSGQWPFVTGCETAAWIYFVCLVVDDRRIQLGSDGVPLMRVMLLPAADVEILDTWRALGLRGTGSHDVRINNAECMDRRSFQLVPDFPRSDATILNIPLMQHAGLFVCAVSIGIAQGALREVTTLALGGKRPAFERVRLSESPLFHQDLGKAEMWLRAARSLLYAQADKAWNAAISGEALSGIEAAAVSATAFQVTDLCARAVNAVHRIAGGSSVYAGGPVERRMRDMHTATQHAWNHSQHVAALGAALLG